MPSAVNDWESGLAVGNGRQGALIHGDPSVLRVTLSHERLFLPVDEPLPPPSTGAIRDRLRHLCLSGEFQSAADEVVTLARAEDPRYDRLRQIDPLVGAAVLTFVPWAPQATGWRTDIDHHRGTVAVCTPTLALRGYARRADDVIVLELIGDVRGRLRLDSLAGAPPVPIDIRTGSEADLLWLEAGFPRRWPGSTPGYATVVRVIVDGCPRLAGGSGLDLDTDRAVLLVRTTIAADPPQPDRWRTLARAVPAMAPSGPDPEHADLMARCRLSLPDDGRVEQLFDAGRHAIIAATGDLPPTLQGVWSGTYDPPWRSGYTLDGNLATALAALGPTGTPSLLLPLFDLVESYQDHFRDNARRLYGAPGFVVPPHLSTHGWHNHFGPRWCLTFWTGGAAWLARIYFDYWRYTGDTAFLATRAWPFMTEAMAFYQAITEGTRPVCLAPSYSPENSSAGDDGPQASVNATHEIALIRDLARNLLAACAALDRTPDPVWQRLLERLPPYEIGPDGQLREWLWPGLPDRPEHRHASHLYGLWYEADPHLRDPALRTAAATTIRRKLAWWAANGDEMAFGLVSLGLAAAALGLADEADDALRRLTHYWGDNLVSTHNAGALFNTDSCGGLPALVVAMLVNGADTELDLLPAAPARWSTGQVSGVLVRGGIQIEELRWSPTSVRLRVRCANPRRLTVTVRGARPQAQDLGLDARTFVWDTG